MYLHFDPAMSGTAVCGQRAPFMTTQRAEANCPACLDPYRQYICDSCGLSNTDLQDVTYNATSGEYFHSAEAHRELRALGLDIPEEQ